MAPTENALSMDSAEQRIVAFTAGSHGLVHTYELSIPILLTVWVGEFSTTAAVLGLVVTVGYGLFGVGALPGGILVDRFGSKPLILACLGGMAGSFLLVSLAPNLLTLALAIAVWGSLRASITRRGCRCSRSRSISAGLRARLPRDRGNLGIALGPLATALLLLAFDWRIVTAALTVPAAVVAAYGLTVDIDDALPDTENAVSDGDIDGDRGSGANGAASLSTIADDTRVLLAGGFLIVFVFVTFSGLYYRTFLTFLPDLLGDVLGGLIDIQLIDPESPYAEGVRRGTISVRRRSHGRRTRGSTSAGGSPIAPPPERALMVLMGILTVLALLFVPASETIVTFIAVSLLLGVVLFTVQPLSRRRRSRPTLRARRAGSRSATRTSGSSVSARWALRSRGRSSPERDHESSFSSSRVSRPSAPSPRPESLGSRRGRTDGRNADNPERFVFGRVFRAVATGPLRSCASLPRGPQRL